MNNEFNNLVSLINNIEDGEKIHNKEYHNSNISLIKTLFLVFIIACIFLIGDFFNINIYLIIIALFIIFLVFFIIYIAKKLKGDNGHISKYVELY